VLGESGSRLYGIAQEFNEGGVPSESYEVPLGEPAIRKEGKDLTLLTFGATLYGALEATKQLEETYGLSSEVIDACERGSYLHTMASKITQLAFDELDAPPVVVGARNWITPPDEVEEAFFPFPVDIIDAVHEHVLPLKGYSVQRDCGTAELSRRDSLGI